jgi:hypothetical protein
VENRTRRAVVVSVASDTAAVMPQFLAGQRGTISIAILDPGNGIGVEILGVPGCAVLAEDTLPTPEPITLVLEDGTAPSTVSISLLGTAVAEPMAQPAASTECLGG